MGISKFSSNDGCGAHCWPAANYVRYAFALIVTLSLLFCFPAGVASVAAEEFKIGIQDKLLVKVGRWRAAEGVYEHWEGVGGEHVVDPEGMIYLALTGAVQARGRTPPEIAEEISGLLQARLGLDQPPATSVEVLEFRPVYVVGAVNNPGSFAYRPEMTVIQAVGLAGGHLRTNNPLLRTEREALSAVGEHEALNLRRWSAIARLARLRAELAGAEKIEMPQELADIPVAVDLMALEQEILAAHANFISSKRASIADLKRLLTSRIETLGEEIDLRNEQVRLANEELSNITSLTDRGLVVNSDQSALSRQALSSIGEFEALRLSQWSVMARLARLRAELAGAEDIETPQELANIPVVADVMVLEREILAAGIEAVRSKGEAIADLKRLLTLQIEKLGEEVILRSKQVELAKEELSNITSLKERGLVVSSRQTALSSTVTELEAKLLNLESTKLTAEQQLNEAIRDELDIVNERRKQIVTELQQAREDLDQIKSRLRTTREVYSAVGDLEVKISGLVVAKLATEQQLNAAARSELDTVNERRNQIVTEMQRARAELDQIDVKLKTTKGLYSEAASRGIGLMNTQIGTEYSYQLMRRRDGQPDRLVVDDQELMKPGDTLQVVAPELAIDASTSSFPQLPD